MFSANKAGIPKRHCRAFPAVLFYTASFAAIFCLVGWLSPLGDDWHYLTSPNPHFSWTDLLPKATFWRPFDALFGALIGLFPNLFPWLNRFLVVFAHVLNAALIKKLLERIGVGQKWSFLCSCFFLFSSAAWAVTVSPDGLNQAYSLFFGILALYLHLTKGGYYFLIFSVLSLLCKESGVASFFVIPLFEIIRSRATLKAFMKDKVLCKRVGVQILLSLLTVAGYFAVRFMLLGSVQLGGTAGNYKISVFSPSVLKNIVLLLASAATGIDSIALLGTPRSMLLVCLTGGLSMLFLAGCLIAIIKQLRKKLPLFPLVCLGLCAIGLAAPSSILGQAGEMHAYPVLFAMALLFGYCFDTAQISCKGAAIGLLAILLAFGISSAHKLQAIYDYSSRTQQVTQQFYTLYENKPGKILCVSIGEKTGYSVFTQSGINGACYGMSIRKLLGWADVALDHHSAKTEEAADAYLLEKQDVYAQIFVVRNDCVEKVK